MFLFYYTRVWSRVRHTIWFIRYLLHWKLIMDSPSASELIPSEYILS